MKRFSGVLGIQQGSRVLFSDFATNGPMWAGSGPREVRVKQDFPEPFLEPPSVMVGISMWDMDHRTNSRVDLQVDEVSATGFDFVFRSWGDSRIARVRADWTAIGSTRDEDSWDVA